MTKIFIDGSAGAAGTVLSDLLRYGGHDILTIADTKSQTDRYDAIHDADIAVLCLPPNVVEQTMADMHDVNTIVIDASIQHRIDPDWLYAYFEGVPVSGAMRISSPGCFAVGMQSILRPLAPFLTGFPIAISGTTGYSAGGKKAIKQYEELPYDMRVTNISRQHIHVCEVQHRAGIKNDIAFTPTVGAFRVGQVVSVPLFQHMVTIPLCAVPQLFEDHYEDSSVVNVLMGRPNSIDLPLAMTADSVQIHVAEPAGSHLVVHPAYNNLGIGSAGNIARIIKEITQ